VKIKKISDDPGCENVTSLQATKIVFLRSMEIERTKELSGSLSRSQRKAVLSILSADGGVVLMAGIAGEVAATGPLALGALFRTRRRDGFDKGTINTGA
jgi:hypothetical protein